MAWILGQVSDAEERRLREMPGVLVEGEFTPSQVDKVVQTAQGRTIITSATMDAGPGEKFLLVYVDVDLMRLLSTE